jgi:hypothetical protein
MAASHSLLIRHLRLSGEEAQPDDDAGQHDDDEGATPGPTAGLPASVAPPGCARPAACRFQHDAPMMWPSGRRTEGDGPTTIALSSRGRA